MRKHSCTFACNAQVQLHFRDDQQRAFGISNISNLVICDVIKQNESELANTVFKIQPNKQSW